MQKPLRLIFAGTTDFSAHLLRALLEHGATKNKQELVALITAPDQAAGRGMDIQQSPVKQMHAERCSAIPLYQPEGRGDFEKTKWLNELGADLMIVVAYGTILPSDCLKIPRYGCVNVHTSLLPRWRGSAPIERAMLAGDKRTGITIMQMDEGVDSGDILLQKECAIDDADDALSLENKLKDLAEAALLKVLDSLAERGHAGLSPKAQEESQAVMASKIQKHEHLLDFQEDARALELRVRALVKRGHARMQIAGPPAMVLKITSAQRLAQNDTAAPGTILSSDTDKLVIACAKDAIALQYLQLPGKPRPMSITQLRNGYSQWFEDGGMFGVGAMLNSPAQS